MAVINPLTPDEVKDLGILTDKDLSFISHIDMITAKAG